MEKRLVLHEILVGILGSRNVYFQPPPNITMVYPCIVYQRDSVDTIFADNSPYRHVKRYQVTVMDENEDSSIPDKLANLPRCIFSRHFTSDNLYQDVYNLYF